MKRLICAVLTLMLVFLVHATLAASDLTDFVCSEESFATKVPGNATVQYEAGTGLQIYIEKPGYIPYVIISRRPDDMQFNNPQNYLNNVFREYMEDKYGSNMIGTNPAKSWEIGGKTLIGARYKYSVSGTTVCLFRLIEVREDGDVEYTAKFIDGDDTKALDVLDIAVRNYTTDIISAGAGGLDDLILVDPHDSSDFFDNAPAPHADFPAPEPAGSAVIEPVDAANREVNTTDGIYWANVTDEDKIMNGGYFTLKLYVQDLYNESQIESLKAGDAVRVNGEIFTVKSTVSHEDGSIELYPEEDFDGYIVFKKESGPFYTALVNDWTPCAHIDDYKVMMPLANNFAYSWISGEDAEIYDADAFVDLIVNDGTEYINQYNTMVQFDNGLVMLIMHTDYPYGPEID